MSWLYEVYVCKEPIRHSVEKMGPSIRENPLPFTAFVYPCVESLPLSRDWTAAEEREFLDVFRERRSVKHLGRCPMEKLSQILYTAVKPYTIDRDDYGMVVYRSASPSAGGRHPIDILVGLPNGQENKHQLYIYQPLSNSLGRLKVDDQRQQDFLDDISQTLPLGESVLIWFSIQYMRTASKYTEYENLIWRDAGAQLCCLQQAAKYYGLDSCPIGYLAEETFKGLFNSNSLMSGGGLIIGLKK